MIRPPSVAPLLDPQSVPVLDADSHLPPVPAERLTADALRQRFATLPAWKAENPDVARPGTPLVPAAVLVALVMRPEGLTVLLTERATGLSTHSGQIAFAGGRIDAHDSSAVAAALREAHEEIGLAPQQAEVLGQLPDYVTGSQFVVTPVVALLPPVLTLQPNPGEVQRIFEVPLAFLMNPAHHRRQQAEWNGRLRQWYAMPYAPVGEGGSAPDDANAPAAPAQHYIWGVTAGILRNLYHLLAA